MTLREPPAFGWVYILTNPAMPGLVKIGHTARHPDERAAELNRATGVPSPFVVAWAHPLADHAALETIVHDQLARYRARHNREFFRCSVTLAREVIEREAATLLLPWWRSWLHRLHHPRPTNRPGRRLRRSRRHRRGGGSDLMVISVALACTYLAVLKPHWLPPGLVHLLVRLPHLAAPGWPRF